MLPVGVVLLLALGSIILACCRRRGCCGSRKPSRPIVGATYPPYNGNGYPNQVGRIPGAAGSLACCSCHTNTLCSSAHKYSLGSYLHALSTSSDLVVCVASRPACCTFPDMSSSCCECC